VTAFQSVAVLGAGTMGHGIAQVAAAAGSRVALYDVDTAAPLRARGRIRANLEKGVSLGKVTAQALGETMERIRTTSDLSDAVRDAQLVIEAAPESLALKRQLLLEVEKAVPQNAVLATNTSSLSIAELADGLAAPARFLGLHFFNPVHVMALVEVVWGPATGKAELERAVAYVKELGKEPVVVKDSPGFASSRLGVLLGLEAMRMVEEGVAEPAGIDRAMELGYRHPMGPLRLTDLVGLDVRLGIAEYLHGRLGSEAFRPPAILRRMVEEGKLGKKSGEGFYRWEDES
jgi:3-hydroxybutyryl-CoA dehydrogenase